MIIIERTIIHSDLNNFYASVECLYNPKLRHIPVGVCGDTESRHGIILAKNQIAKNFGVSTGEAIWQAKQKCPKLTLVSANFKLYLKFSKLAKEIYTRYTDQTESFGIDESWLDVSGSIGILGTGEKIANEIRSTIYNELGITASVGVSYNKIFAKLGSDMKKPNATTVITKENYKDLVWNLPVSDLLYVGRSTTKKLDVLGVKTIGNLANTDTKTLFSHLGKWGLILNQFANGWDNSPVTTTGSESFIKSVGNSTTTPRDLITLDDVKSVIYMLSDSVATRLREHNLKCTTVQISIRDKNLLSCERQEKLDIPTHISSEIANKALDIFIKKYRFNYPIRSIGVRGTGLVNENSNMQLDLFNDFVKRERMEQVEKTIDQIRNRFGYHSVKKGILLVDKSITGLNPKDEHVIHPNNFF